MNSLHQLKSYIIVVRDNEPSEYYYNLVLPKWHDLGIFPERFEATTPDTLCEELEFGVAHFNGFDYKGYKKTITPTERACFCSHYRLWQRCWELGERILILEHDAYPYSPEHIIDDPSMDYYSLARGTGAYIISPQLACYFLLSLDKSPYVEDTNLAWIDRQMWQSNLQKLRKWKAHMVDRDEMEMPVRHAFNPKYGLSIDHYGGTELEHEAWRHQGAHDMIIED